MVFSAYFQYPEGEENQHIEALVFLAKPSIKDWERVFSCTGTRRFKQGEIVIQKGDMDQALYIVSQGSLEVIIPEGMQAALTRIATIEAGEVFGEQSFFDKKPRSQTVRAMTDGEVLVLSRESFDVLAGREPDLGRTILFDLARILSIRLRQTTAMMMELASH
ncbi:MAG TPA: cyclic nucleotide-binding domain-containing protein [Candidatus Obscuribacterales bacterium]